MVTVDVLNEHKLFALKVHLFTFFTKQSNTNSTATEHENITQTKLTMNWAYLPPPACVMTNQATIQKVT